VSVADRVRYIEEAMHTNRADANDLRARLAILRDKHAQLCNAINSACFAYSHENQIAAVAKSDWVKIVELALPGGSK